MPGKNNVSDAENKEEEEKPKANVGGGRKEKSVLQAKLTKLAIQIGYAGKDLTKHKHDIPSNECKTHSSEHYQAVKITAKANTKDFDLGR